MVMVKAQSETVEMIQMQLGAESEFAWIINLAFFAFIIVFSLYGARIQMWQWLKQIETGLIELKKMAIESRQTSDIRQTSRACMRCRNQDTIFRMRRMHDWWSLVPIRHTARIPTAPR